MHIYYSDTHLPHDPQSDWEVAARATMILDELGKANLGTFKQPDDFGMDPITAVHDQKMLHFLQNAFTQMQAEKKMSEVIPNCFATRHLDGHLPQTIWGQLGYYCTDSTTPIMARTWEAAYWAVQTTLSTTQHVLQNRNTAYALCRPPGHHAYADLYGGYCYLNNVAIAAHWLTAQQQKVAIVDVDYHHGNGTQAIFYDRDDVLFCSIHADPDQDYPFYSGFEGETGHGAGLGYNHNYPLPLGTNGRTYLETLQQAIQNVAQFNPDILLISLGVDTAKGDPNGEFLLEQGDFAAMGQLFAQVDLPKVVVQEGGYILDSIGKNVHAFLQNILSL